jgi:flagellar biosynthesis protein FlhF
MQLRTFTGRTTMEAMGLVRAHLGPRAVIVSTQEDGFGGARVTAALDEQRARQAPEPAPPFVKSIADALAFHGVPGDAHATILEGSRARANDNAIDALARGLGTFCRFAPLAQKDRRPLILVGPQGGGKTATAAKLAARAVLAGEPVRLVTTDLVRAGGVAQLASFAKILGAPFATADEPRRLAATLAAADPGERVIIDTGGVNPFDAGDRSELDALIGGCAAEPVLVFAAGGDVAETVGMAETFRDLGCARAIVTRIDTVRRLGAVLGIAHLLSRGLAEAGIAPDIADGLVPFTPMLLARLLLPKGAS